MPAGASLPCWHAVRVACRAAFYHREPARRRRGLAGTDNMAGFLLRSVAHGVGRSPGPRWFQTVAGVADGSVGTGGGMEDGSGGDDPAGPVTSAAAAAALKAAAARRAAGAADVAKPKNLAQILEETRGGKPANATAPRPRRMAPRASAVTQASLAGQRTPSAREDLPVLHRSSTALQKVQGLVRYLMLSSTAERQHAARRLADQVGVSCGWRNSPDERLSKATRQLMALLGCVDFAERKGNYGIRVLTIDGGGTKALVAIEMLKELERKTGRRVHEMFDLIAGASTGAVMA